MKFWMHWIICSLLMYSSSALAASTPKVAPSAVKQKNKKTSSGKAAKKAGKSGLTTSQIRELVQMLAHRDKAVRTSSRKELIKLKKVAVPHLVWALSLAKDIRMRFAILQILESIGPDSRGAIKLLSKMLTDKKTDKRILGMILYVFIAMKAQAAPAWKSISSLLKHKDFRVRATAADALGRTGVLVAVIDLGAALKDKHYTVRYTALKALERMGSKKAVSVMPQVLKALKDKNRFVRSAAMTLVKELGKNPLSVNFLIKAVLDKDPRLRFVGIQLLGGLKLHGLKGVTVLLVALDDPYVVLRQNARKSLEQILADPKWKVRILTKKLRSWRWQARKNAARELGQLGVQALPALPFLELMLVKEKKTPVKTEVFHALQKIRKFIGKDLPTSKPTSRPKK